MKATVGHRPFSNQFSNVPAYFLVFLTNFRSSNVRRQFVLDTYHCYYSYDHNKLCCQEINKLGGMFTLWYMVFPPILFISQQQEHFNVNCINIRFLVCQKFDWLLLLSQYQYVKATPVMSDQVALQSDEVQIATERYFEILFLTSWLKIR